MRRLAFAILGLLLAVQGQAQSIVPAPPQVSAEAFILVDAATGFVIAGDRPDATLPPASLTKLMTSYVLANEIAEGRLTRDESAVVSENAWSQNPVFKGSSLMWIEPGRDVTIGELERGIVIASGNDATVAVAEHIAGSEQAFAELMNQHAERLGLSNTHFMNSHGLPHPDHYTSARDLAKLSAALIRNFPAHYARYRELDYTYNDIKQYNRNKLLREDPPWTA